MCTGKPNGALRQRRTELNRRIIWNRISCHPSDCSKGCILLSFQQPRLLFALATNSTLFYIVKCFKIEKKHFLKILKLIYTFHGVFQRTYPRRKVRRSRKKNFACLYFPLRIHNGEAASSGKMAAASVSRPTMQRCSQHLRGYFNNRRLSKVNKCRVYVDQTPRF